MGQGQGAQFREKFENLSIQKETKQSLWFAFDARMPEDALNTDHTGGSGSSGSSPTGSGGGGGRMVEVTVWQMNNAHATFSSASIAPKQKDYKVRWSPMTFTAEALQWVRRNPHANLVNIYHVEPCGDELYAVSKQLLAPLMPFLTTLHPTELLYGLCNVIDGLTHMHDRGMSHRNLNWNSLYIDESAARRFWVIGDFHFLSPNDPVEPSTGRSPTTDLLNEIRSLREAKHLPFVAPEENNPGGLDFMSIVIGAGDVFSFGQLIEQVVSHEKRAPHTVNVGGREDCSVKAAADSLKHFAKQCMSPDPTRRPPLKSFFELPCVKFSTFVSIMRFLDLFMEKTEREKVHFFSTLHLELIKLPYELFVGRVLPRLLTMILWNDPAAEIFVQHLMTPFRGKVPAEPFTDVNLGGNKPGGSSGEASPTSKGTQAMSTPSRLDGSATDGSPAATAPTPSGLEVHGLLQTKEYHSHVAPFLKSALGQNKKPQLLCTLFRNVEAYVVSVDLSIVNKHIIPSIIANLRHTCHDVVLEALRAFTVVCRFVFSATDRGSDCGNAVDLLTAAFDKEVFSIAASDTVLHVRLTALGIAARSFSSRRQLMTPKKAVGALCHALGAPATADNDTRIVASKGMLLIRKIMEVLAPQELIADILPSLMQLNATASVAAATAGGDCGASPERTENDEDETPNRQQQQQQQQPAEHVSWDLLRDESLKLSLVIVANVRDRDSEHTPQQPPSASPEDSDSGAATEELQDDESKESTEPMVGETAKNDDGDEVIVHQHSKRRSKSGSVAKVPKRKKKNKKAADEHDDDLEGFMEDGGKFHGRAKIDSEGWLSLRAPCEWSCRTSSAQQAQLARAAPTSEKEGVIGAHDCPSIPNDLILSYHDYDQEFNEHYLLTTSRVMGALTIAKKTPHPLAMRLATRHQFKKGLSGGAAGSPVVEVATTIPSATKKKRVKNKKEAAGAAAGVSITSPEAVSTPADVHQTPEATSPTQTPEHSNEHHHHEEEVGLVNSGSFAAPSPTSGRKASVVGGKSVAAPPSRGTAPRRKKPHDLDLPVSGGSFSHTNALRGSFAAAGGTAPSGGVGGGSPLTNPTPDDIEL